MDANVGATAPKRKRNKRATVKRKQLSMTLRSDGIATVQYFRDQAALLDRLAMWLAAEHCSVWRLDGGHIVVTEAWGCKTWGKA